MKGQRVSYDTDVSIHRYQPHGLASGHTYLGWSQGVQVGGFRLTQILQVDEDPASNGWRLSRLRLRGTAPLADGFQVHGSLAVRRPYLRWSPAQIFGTRRDEVSLGVSRWGARFFATAELTLDRYEVGGDGQTYSASLGVPSGAANGWGMSVAGNYWTQRGLSGFFASPSVTRQFGVVHVRAGYQFLQSQGLALDLVTHGADVSLSFPVGPLLLANVRARAQVGDTYTSFGARASLSWRF